MVAGRAVLVHVGAPTASSPCRHFAGRNHATKRRALCIDPDILYRVPHAADSQGEISMRFMESTKRRSIFERWTSSSAICPSARLTSPSSGPSNTAQNSWRIGTYAKPNSSQREFSRWSNPGSTMANSGSLCPSRAQTGCGLLRWQQRHRRLLKYPYQRQSGRLCTPGVPGVLRPGQTGTRCADLAERCGSRPRVASCRIGGQEDVVCPLLTPLFSKSDARLTAMQRASYGSQPPLDFLSFIGALVIVS